MYHSKLVAPQPDECLRIKSLSGGGIMFKAWHFGPGNTRGHYIREFQPSYVIKKMIWGLFMAVFLKMGAIPQKGRVADVSYSRPDFG
jgi:hypothetical protein